MGHQWWPQICLDATAEQQSRSPGSFPASQRIIDSPKYLIFVTDPKNIYMEVNDESMANTKPNTNYAKKNTNYAKKTPTMPKKTPNTQKTPNMQKTPNTPKIFIYAVLSRKKFCSKFTHFVGVLFTDLKSMVVYQNGQISGMLHPSIQFIVCNVKFDENHIYKYI